MTKFTLAKEHLYWWPVEIKMPDPAKPGKFHTQKFQMQFRAQPTDEARELTREIEGLPAEQQAEREHAHLICVCRDWNEDVVDEDNKPIAFSEDRLRQALQFAWFRMGLYTAYRDSIVGDEARKGN
jgi:hypothetical protein